MTRNGSEKAAHEKQRNDARKQDTREATAASEWRKRRGKGGNHSEQTNDADLVVLGDTEVGSATAANFAAVLVNLGVALLGEDLLG